MTFIPTLIDICDVPSAIGLEGQSLTPLLSDVEESWNHPAVTTWFHNNHASAILGGVTYAIATEVKSCTTTKRTRASMTTLRAIRRTQRQIERLSKWLPAVNKLPKGGMPDGFANAVKSDEESGVPAWLE